MAVLIRLLKSERTFYFQQQLYFPDKSNKCISNIFIELEME